MELSLRLGLSSHHIMAMKKEAGKVTNDITHANGERKKESKQAKAKKTLHSSGKSLLCDDDSM